jgi:hypothetical protein
MISHRYVAKCSCCKTVSSALLAGHPTSESVVGPMPTGVVFYSRLTGSIVTVCRTCGRNLYARLVRGKFSAKHECSAKCLASTGTVCECSCAGKNHGAAYC